MKKLIAQVLKFGVVGGTAFLIDYGIMIVLTEFCGINYLISSGISFVVSVIYNYILSVHWVFDVDKDGDKKKEFIVFILLSVIGLGLNQLLMWVFVSRVHVGKDFCDSDCYDLQFCYKKIFFGEMIKLEGGD